MGALKYSKGKYHDLIVQGGNNTKSKEKKIVKEKKPKSDIGNESSNPTDEGSMKKVKKKGSTSKCFYSNKVFNPKKKFFKNNMDIMSWVLENQNIKVPDELEKSVESSEHCHSAQFQGDISYALSPKVK